MRKKLSNLTKKVLPFLMFSVIVNSAYGFEKLNKDYLRVKPESSKFEDIKSPEEKKEGFILYGKFPNEDPFYFNKREGKSPNKEFLPISVVQSNDREFYRFEREKNYWEKSTYKNNLSISLISSGEWGSYHFERDKYYEKNGTYGFDIQFPKGTKIFGIQLKKEMNLSLVKTTNSFKNPTNAIILNSKFTCTNTPINLCAGGAIGIMDGYGWNNYKPSLTYPTPYASIDYKNIIGLDFYMNPLAIVYVAKIKLFEF